MCNSSAGGVTGGKPNWKRWTDLSRPFWSTGPDVLKTPSGGKSAHRACAKHVEDGDNPKEQRHHGDGRKELE